MFHIRNNKVSIACYADSSAIPQLKAILRPSPCRATALTAFKSAIMTFSSSPLARRVLIIDDNTDAAELLVSILVVLGHDARMANDGASGIEMARNFRPEVIFLDLGMPKMNGYDAAIELRKLSDLQKTLIVALTGWNDSNTKQRALASGFDIHMTKPAPIQDIEEILQAA